MGGVFVPIEVTLAGSDDSDDILVLAAEIAPVYAIRNRRKVGCGESYVKARTKFQFPATVRFRLNYMILLYFSGEPCRIRTCDPLIKSQLLYQLS